MTTFSYTAKSKTGEEMSGSIDATGKTDAIRKLEHMGFVPISIMTMIQKQNTSTRNHSSRYLLRFSLMVILGVAITGSTMWFFQKRNAALSPLMNFRCRLDQMQASFTSNGISLLGSIEYNVMKTDSLTSPYVADLHFAEVGCSFNRLTLVQEIAQLTSDDPIMENPALTEAKCALEEGTNLLQSIRQVLARGNKDANQKYLFKLA